MTARRPRRLCPECGARVRPGKKEIIVRGVSLGTFAVHECPRCGEASLTPRGWAAADRTAKARGVWGPAPPDEPHTLLHAKAHA